MHLNKMETWEIKIQLRLNFQAHTPTQTHMPTHTQLQLVAITKLTNEPNSRRNRNSGIDIDTQRQTLHLVSCPIARYWLKLRQAPEKLQLFWPQVNEKIALAVQIAVFHVDQEEGKLLYKPTVGFIQQHATALVLFL